MIGLDANVLVRYLTQDDPRQSARATELIERRLTETDPGFVSVVALVETVWVLKRGYGFADRQIATAIEWLLKADAFVIENEPEVFAAMVALKHGDGSVADMLIGALGRKAGCSVTVTFDRKAAHLPGFALV